MKMEAKRNLPRSVCTMLPQRAVRLLGLTAGAWAALASIFGCDSIDERRDVVRAVRIEPANLELKMGKTSVVVGLALDANDVPITNASQRIRSLDTSIVDVPQTCVGGSKAGKACSDNAGCPSGRCQPHRKCAGGPRKGAACQNDAACGSGQRCGIEIRAQGAGKVWLSASVGGISSRDSTSTATVEVACPDSTTTTATTHAGTLSKSEVWTAAGNPHEITDDLIVSGQNADGTPIELTIQSCTRVKIAKAGIAIRVGVGNVGRLKVLGSSSTEGRVTIEPKGTASAGYWTGIVVDASSADTTGFSIIQHALIDKAGGGTASTKAGLVLTSPTKMLGVTVKDSGGFGVILGKNSHLDQLVRGASLESVTVTNAKLAPWLSHPNVAGNIPLDKRGFNDNNGGDEEIHVTSGRVRRSQNWGSGDLQVPYRILNTCMTTDTSCSPGRVVVSAPAIGASLHILGGTRVLFSRDTRLEVGTIANEAGNLVAGLVGSLQIIPKKLLTTFTSGEDNPAEGDWGGVILGPNSPNSLMFGVNFAYAGGKNGLVGLDGDYASEDRGALIVLGRLSIFFGSSRQLTASDSGKYGMIRGFQGTIRKRGSALTASPGLIPGNNIGESSLPNPLKLSTDAVKAGVADPEALCRSGAKGQSPALSWEFSKEDPLGVDQVTHYAILLTRPGFPSEPVRWGIYNIPKDVSSIKAGATAADVSGATIIPLKGSCPSIGSNTCEALKKKCDRHDEPILPKECSNLPKCQYRFTIYALKGKVTTTATTTKGVQADILKQTIGQTFLEAIPKAAQK